ncbi:sarcoplasmic calcium-binding protein-like [Watersipora subatra]|uniref:sarcoplasmic calcium-binding protein-like n=1 Tax=Watersipora subatra TaxID=2589382 RepID=UPI00355C1D88
MHTLSNIASGIRTLFGTVPGMNGGSALGDNSFWQRKMLTHFTRMDMNGDNFVSRDDFKSLVKSLANKAKLSDQRAFLMQRLVIQLWEDFWCCGEDKGFEYKVPVEEFLGLVINLLKLSDSKALLEEPLSLLFGVIDLDGNGVVNIREWTIYNEAIGVSENDAVHSFEVCFDSKTEVTKEDFIAVGQAFFTVTDERHTSRHLWGPLV